VSDYERALGALAARIGGLRAALVFESSGIEVCSWGGADPDLNAAEFAELLGRLGDVETLVAEGALDGITLSGADGQWVLVPLGTEYALALLADPAVPPGKLRFYADEWAALHREEFA
jgi:predicted regulator of Ras-like GTPase activity (Roadblock/LC7/MglB family)